MTAREQLYQVIQGHAGDPDMTGAPEDALLTGFLVIAEWEAPDGERWISKNSADAGGRGLPPWRERGMAAEVVHSSWGDEDEGEA